MSRHTCLCFFFWRHLIESRFGCWQSSVKTSRSWLSGLLASSLRLLAVNTAIAICIVETLPTCESASLVIAAGEIEMSAFHRYTALDPAISEFSRTII